MNGGHGGDDMRDNAGREPVVPVLGYQAPVEDARWSMPYKTQVWVGVAAGVLYLVYCTLTGLGGGMWSYGGAGIWFWVGVRWLPFIVAAGWVWRRRAAGWGPAEVKVLLGAAGLMVWRDLGRLPFIGIGPIGGLASGALPLAAAVVATLAVPRWRGIGVGLIVGVGVMLLIGVGGVVVICGNMRF